MFCFILEDSKLDKFLKYLRIWIVNQWFSTLATQIAKSKFLDHKAGLETLVLTTYKPLKGKCGFNIFDNLSTLWSPSMLNTCWECKLIILNLLESKRRRVILSPSIMLKPDGWVLTSTWDLISSTTFLRQKRSSLFWYSCRKKWLVRFAKKWLPRTHLECKHSFQCTMRDVSK